MSRIFVRWRCCAYKLGLSDLKIRKIEMQNSWTICADCFHHFSHHKSPSRVISEVDAKRSRDYWRHNCQFAVTATSIASWATLEELKYGCFKGSIPLQSLAPIIFQFFRKFSIFPASCQTVVSVPDRALGILLAAKQSNSGSAKFVHWGDLGVKTLKSASVAGVVTSNKKGIWILNSVMYFYFHCQVPWKSVTEWNLVNRSELGRGPNTMGLGILG